MNSGKYFLAHDIILPRQVLLPEVLVQLQTFATACKSCCKTFTKIKHFAVFALEYLPSLVPSQRRVRRPVPTLSKEGEVQQGLVAKTSPQGGRVRGLGRLSERRTFVPSPWPGSLRPPDRDAGQGMAKSCKSSTANGLVSLLKPISKAVFQV